MREQLQSNFTQDVWFFPVRLPTWLRHKSLRHLLFWSALLVYEGLIWGMVDGEFNRRIVTAFIELPIKMMATYFTIYYLIDRLLMKRKYLWFFNALLLSVVGFAILMRIQGYYLIYPIYLPEATEAPLFYFPKIFIALVNLYSLVAILASFHMTKLWFLHERATRELQEIAQKLQNEKLEAELKVLKSQINPHFLFNTLNNLYVLTLKHSDKAPETVYRLSELMNYMLYESNQPKVFLEKEIQYIQNYIALEKLRYNPNVDIGLKVYGETSDIQVAPLLILPFVENGFKHGLNKERDSGWLTVDIQVKANTVTVKVENSKEMDGTKTPRLPSGIGLENVRKRLDLIYPGRYELKIFSEEQTFLAVLKITIADSDRKKSMGKSLSGKKTVL